MGPLVLLVIAGLVVTGLVLSSLVPGAGVHLGRHGVSTVTVHRSRTDIPREVPPVPPVAASRAPHAVGPPHQDPSAARAITWPLPRECSTPETREARGQLPRTGGYSADPSSLGDGARLRRVLGIRDGRLVALDGAGSPGRCDALHWQVIAAAIPAGQRAWLDQVVLYDYPQSVLSGASAQGGVRTGFFEPNPSDPRSFRIALATDLSDDEQLLTLAHEIGHVASLYPDRPHARDDADCSWVIDNRGTCASASSALDRFFASTYDAPTRARVADLYADHRQPSQDALRQVYAVAPERYVSAYAATHPTEDFAESYAYWCLWGTSTDAPVEGASTNGLAKREFMDREARAGRLDGRGCTVLSALAARGNGAR